MCELCEYCIVFLFVSYLFEQGGEESGSPYAAQPNPPTQPLISLGSNAHNNSDPLKLFTCQQVALRLIRAYRHSIQAVGGLTSPACQ